MSQRKLLRRVPFPAWIVGGERKIRVMIEGRVAWVVGMATCPGPLVSGEPETVRCQPNQVSPRDDKNE
jgi:hypothetical protein